MASISIFDMFKIGVGPSSSHTMGPWNAAAQFMNECLQETRCDIASLKVDLYGSLAKTGVGHGTSLAIQLGLCGYRPDTVDVDKLFNYCDLIAAGRKIRTLTGREFPFCPDSDLVFHFDKELPFHPNGMCISAVLSDGTAVSETYYSVGGGFVVCEDQRADTTATAELPFPIENASELLEHCEKQSAPISQVVYQNELTWRTGDGIRRDLLQIMNAMIACAHRGCYTEGTLPGGLNVQRRASRTATQLLDGPCPDSVEEWLVRVSKCGQDFQGVLDWVSCFALAVNEENAAFGRVVTAPTNGSAGVIPAVLLYFRCFRNATTDQCLAFLMTAAEIGSIFKKGATISAALGGCQAEIGVSSAMAAAALTEGLGGSPQQAAEAAEIAMEHHLGMTCDPVGGLVQIPCIERNAMGAMKAITAARMALQRDPSEARVSLDAVVETMWNTALDMNSKYKETSEGGLAVQIAVSVSEC